MSKLNKIDKIQLIRLASVSSASAIAFKNNLNANDVYEIYKKHKIQHLLKYSPRFVKNFQSEKGFSDNKICKELNISKEYLIKCCESDWNSSCRFEKANKICKSLNYKGSVDYISKNGYKEFIKHIKPQII
jgi:hypothetical protein